MDVQGMKDILDWSNESIENNIHPSLKEYEPIDSRYVPTIVDHIVKNSGLTSKCSQLDKIIEWYVQPFLWDQMHRMQESKIDGVVSFRNGIRNWVYKTLWLAGGDKILTKELRR